MNYDYQLIQTVGLDTAEELMLLSGKILGKQPTNDAVERAKQAGLNPEQINHIRNSSGARRVNMMNQLLRDKADNYGLHISENENILFHP